MKIVNRPALGISTSSHKFRVISYHLVKRTERVLLAEKDHMSRLQFKGRGMSLSPAVAETTLTVTGERVEIRDIASHHKV